MSPIDWAARPLRHYADFEGRSPRSEYWWFQLFQWVVYFVVGMFLGFVGAALGGGEGAFLAVIGGIVLLVFALFIPNLACIIRRLHDQDLTGWVVLVFFIPYVGGLIGLVFMCIRGTQGQNKYGPDPFTEEHLERVFA